jgi:hypothetical protein
MTSNDILTFSMDRYGMVLNTDPLYLEITWGVIALVVVGILGLRTLKKRKKTK